MINRKVFFQGLKSLKGSRSPAIPLAACFIALGALLKDAGFNLQQSVASSLFTYALPGQLVMAESLLVGASLLNIFLAVWFVNARLYPMTVSLFALMMHKNQPRWDCAHQMIYSLYLRQIHLLEFEHAQQLLIF